MGLGFHEAMDMDVTALRFKLKKYDFLAQKKDEKYDRGSCALLFQWDWAPRPSCVVGRRSHILVEEIITANVYIYG